MPFQLSECSGIISTGDGDKLTEGFVDVVAACLDYLVVFSSIHGTSPTPEGDF